MKRIIYIALVVLSSSLTFTSCTEEEVTPNTEIESATGGAGNELPR